VLDVGVDLNHPDLHDNLLLPGFDATVNAPGGVNGSPLATDAHGTACAGIIAAVNNTIGIVGVAPNVRMIPIRIFYHSPNGNLVYDATWAINGINHAWQIAQADVLSCSWHWGSSVVAITNAITNAATNGRNNLGCVVVFSSGNESSSTVSYPASLSNVISVGAINRNGQRAGFSNYGTNLKVVAPGVDIYTTGMLNATEYGNVLDNGLGVYFSGFSGSSAACPHVAGVAALILSARPDLSRMGVELAIIANCTQLPGYSGINGNLWNDQVGWGLVNAYASVYSVASRINGPNDVCYGGSPFSLVNQPSGTITWTVTGPFSFSSTSTIQTTTGNAPYLYRIATNSNSKGTLTASLGDWELASKTITPCATTISGSGTVCYSGNNFTLLNPPPDTIYWTVSNTSIFTVTSSGNPSKVTRIGISSGSATLSARVGSTSGTVVATASISTCTSSISGTNTLCFNNDKFTLNNAPLETIYWSVDNSNFSVVSSGNPTTVTHIGPNGSSVTLSARISSISGAVVATKYFASCYPYIDGPSMVCGGSTFTLVNSPPSQTIYWTVTDPTLFNVNSSGNPTIVTSIGVGGGNAKLHARTGSTSGPLITDLVITSCTASTAIFGSGNICNSGSAVFSITTGLSASWSVTAGFSVYPYTGASTTVYATTANQSGTLTAVVNGVTYTKYIQSLTTPGCYFPMTDYVYMTDLPCGAFVDLHPYPSFKDPNAIYKWVVWNAENCYHSISTGSDSHSFPVQFYTGNDGVLRVDAHQYISPYGYSPLPTVEYRIFAGCSRSSPLMVYPNPVSDILTVDVEALVHLSPTSGKSLNSPNFDIRLYDGQGNLLRQQKAKGGTVQFNVSDLPFGVYYLHVYDGVSETPEMRQIVVEH